jgi:quercetin dioxygenase-like cupin family protein
MFVRDHRRTFVGLVSAALVVAAAVGTASAQQRTLADGQYKVEPLVTTDLAEVGLAGTNAAQRVTVAPGSKTAEHTHTGRTSLLIMVQGTLTEVRGAVKTEYKPGDVVKVSEGVSHHAENYGTSPVVYIEINTTAKK